MLVSGKVLLSGGLKNIYLYWITGIWCDYYFDYDDYDSDLEGSDNS